MIKSILQGRFIDHPLHPILVHLPVGLWVASFIFDICFLASANGTFAQASWYCMLIGLIGAGLSAIAGLAEYIDIPRNSMPHRIATAHLVINLGVTAVYLGNLIWRHAAMGMVPTLVLKGQFFLSLFSVLALCVSGYLGGLLVYNYGIGFKPQLRDKPREDIRRAA
jgi:uncharacterized membrane protein